MKLKVTCVERDNEYFYEVDKEEGCNGDCPTCGNCCEELENISFESEGK